MKLHSSVCTPLALSTAFLGSFISPPQRDAARLQEVDVEKEVCRCFARLSGFMQTIRYDNKMFLRFPQTVALA